jgi:hypothetical protein
MAEGNYNPRSSLFPTQEWREAYQCVLAEMDKSALFKRVEVAEAAILTCRNTLGNGPDQRAERQAIQEALENLKLIKSERLNFSCEE